VYIQDIAIGNRIVHSRHSDRRQLDCR